MSIQRPKYKPRQFDFEIGHLQKSPCRECYARFTFPTCFDDCALLDRIQTTLARSVLTSCNHSPVESFAVRIEERQKK
jgi:hypothetical protein